MNMSARFEVGDVVRRKDGKPFLLGLRSQVMRSEVAIVSDVNQRGDVLVFGGIWWLPACIEIDPSWQIAKATRAMARDAKDTVERLQYEALSQESAAEAYLRREVEKPPLGLMPEKIWREQRIEEIVDAMHRYIEAGKDMPDDWMKELRLHRNIQREMP